MVVVLPSRCVDLGKRSAMRSGGSVFGRCQPGQDGGVPGKLIPPCIDKRRNLLSRARVANRIVIATGKTKPSSLIHRCLGERGERDLVFSQ